MGFLGSALVSSLLLAGNTLALDPIVMKGTKFFYKNGTQFFIKGVAYQQNTGAAGTTTGTKYKDPLIDQAACARDVPILANIGTNVVRTYAVDPNGDHDACMKLLADAGIYVVSDLGEPALSIEQDNSQWNTDLFDRYKGVIDNLGKYDNTIGFFAGNEVSNNATNTPASAFVKAAVRDSKKYIASTKSRWMGVGYAANDDADIRADIAHYFNCGNQSDAIDFWGYNIYEWCGQNTFTGSGYSTQVDFFKNYSVPVFFAEYGCNTQGGADGRIWQETTALYSNDMTGVMSGGIVYMYFEEANDYGLVSVTGSSVSTLKNYKALQTVIASVAPSSTAMSAYTPTNSPQPCPAVGSTWKANSVLPPTPDRSLCECMFASLSCAPASGLSTQRYGDIFDFIYGNAASVAAGINANGTTGVYGPYSMCNSTQKLGYVLDAYYKSQKSAKDACSFAGKAQLVSSNVQGSCSASLASASAAASVAATATGGSASSTSSGKSAAGTLRLDRVFSLGDMALGMYVLVAAGVGAGMVLL